MICENCQYAVGFGASNGVNNIVCKNYGELKISQSYDSTYECNLFKERVYVEPPKNNIYVACTHGYSKKLYDEEIKSIEDLNELMATAFEVGDFVRFGHDWFNTNEIACISYLGD